MFVDLSLTVDSEAVAFALLPLSFALGSTLGVSWQAYFDFTHFSWQPMIGGFLADPLDQYPHLFKDIAILREYPYLLACGVSALFPALALVLGAFFLEETLPRSPVTHSGTEEEGTAPKVVKRAGTKDLLTRRVFFTLLNYA
jgi:hypothetical protein